MTPDPHEMIDAYLDDVLPPESVSELAHWIRANEENAREFAAAVRLHDRLRDELMAAAIQASGPERKRLETRASGGWAAWRRTALTGVAASIIASLALWWTLSGSPAAAAAVELNRIIAAAAGVTDRTYRLSLEEVAAGRPPAATSDRPELKRPPKQPLDNATLTVGSGHRFVLVRTTRDGQPFVTGSDGHESWAVRPDGPVLFSRDPAHFGRDVPGHEHGMSLIDLNEALNQLRAAYEIRVLPVEQAESGNASPSEATRLLVGVKKPAQLGPLRVEVTYVVATGRIVQMRFIDMPYGPDRVTIRLTMENEDSRGDAFYTHATHHTADRAVEEEDLP
jgi:hypothetical protein